jgi:hypothetical protein
MLSSPPVNTHGLIGWKQEADKTILIIYIRLFAVLVFNDFNGTITGSAIISS